MENVELYNYLKKNYTKVEVLNNGLYHAVDSNSNQIYINPKSATNLNVVVSFPGVGGGDSARVANLMNSSNPPDYCAFISTSSQDKGKVFNKVDSLFNNTNYNLKGLVTSSFSASGGLGIAATTDYISKRPQYAGVTSIVINEGNWVMNQKSSAYSVLKNNNIPVIIISGVNKAENKNNVIKLTKMGINATRITSEDKTHVHVPVDTFKNGIPEYILGLTDSVGNAGYSSKSSRPNYKVYKYNKKTQSYELVDINTIKLNTIIKPENIEIFDSKSLYIGDGFKITNEGSDAAYNFSDLKSLSDVSINIPSNLANAERIKNDVQFVTSSMNSIRSQVKSTSFLNNASFPKFRSYGGIPGCIAAYIDKFYDYVGDLMDILVEETDAITSLGQVMVDMDNDLAERGETLGTVKEIERVPKQRNKKYTNRTDIIPEDEKEMKTPNNKNTDTSNGGTHRERKTGGAYTDKKVPNTETVNRVDGSKLLIKTDANDNVTSVVYTYEFGSEEEAEAAYEQIKEKYKGVDYVEAVLLNHTKINVIFKKESYKGLSSSEIQSKFK